MIEYLERISKNPPQDAETRHKVAAALRNAQAALPLQLVVAKVAVDMGVFRVLGGVEEGTELTFDAIIEKTGMERALLARILRFLSANSLISQVTSTSYFPTATTIAFSQPGFSAAIKHHFEAQLPAWSALPSFLSDTSYHEPASAEHTAFQVAHETPLTAFTMRYQNQSSWRILQCGWEPNGKEKKGEDEVLLVDVGVGMGHQCRALKAWIPTERKPRIIVQDLPLVVLRAGEIEGVELMEHDFWKEQPVKGAKFHYLRNVLHDYSDEGCKTILKHIKNALSSNSTIIIDELVLPDRVDGSTGMEGASMDILLMASLAGQERTGTDWHELLRGEGLAIREVKQYSHRGHSVLFVGRAD
ncbi:S-adenosyl-L-methionine-dependent methyltransferase [Pleomassaria siparia CBS 279.74]|uniref:S-adenosyl-L-methionine-dependent methyltransferase n=1 Tax=Pleomassaria siparia CBS 279.74 TaxID=1314801 RepID=A0A6G1K147_9PLEO|nr:S-adenosyl-L-methionine-dependent methyltransferase [Pleomassaria siparia CBS 279.74]